MKFNRFISCVVWAWLAGCGSNGFAGIPEMEIEIVNQSSHRLENALARFGEYKCVWGYVGKTASYMLYPHPITAQAELQWDENGKHRAEKIDLRKIYPRGKSGRLTFAVHDDRVEVSFRETPAS
jgi:hypothetical protein